MSAKGKKTKRVSITTKLVLIVSNWGFVRDNKDLPEKVRCTAHDVAIGLKLASSQFRPEGSSSGGTKTSTCPYDFDAHGAVIPYPAFLSLLKDETFTRDFIGKIRKRYEADTGLSALATKAGAKKVQENDKGAAWQVSLRQKLAQQFPELEDSFGLSPSRSAQAASNVARKSAHLAEVSGSSDSSSSDSEVAGVEAKKVAGKPRKRTTEESSTEASRKKKQKKKKEEEEDEEEEEEEIESDPLAVVNPTV